LRLFYRSGPRPAGLVGGGLRTNAESLIVNNFYCADLNKDIAMNKFVKLRLFLVLSEIIVHLRIFRSRIKLINTSTYVQLDNLVNF
jgi:hypothetical protein